MRSTSHNLQQRRRAKGPPKRSSGHPAKRLLPTSVFRTVVISRFHYPGLIRVERDVASVLSFPEQRAFAGRQRGFTSGRPHGGNQLRFGFPDPSFHLNIVMAGW